MAACRFSGVDAASTDVRLGGICHSVTLRRVSEVVITAVIERKMQVTIEVDDQRLNKALMRLQIPKSREEETGRQITSLSLELYLEWLLNEHRSDSVSQATEHWVAKTEEALFPEEPPSATRLYGRYSLAMPRARYLARSLMARNKGRWRAGARRELLVKLRAIEADARAAEAERPEQNFDCVMTRSVYDEFQVFYEMARTEEHPRRLLTPPRVVSTFLQEVTVRINGLVILNIIDLIEKMKEAP